MPGIETCSAARVPDTGTNPVEVVGLLRGREPRDLAATSNDAAEGTVRRQMATDGARGDELTAYSAKGRGAPNRHWIQALNDESDRATAGSAAAAEAAAAVAEAELAAQAMVETLAAVSAAARTVAEAAAEAARAVSVAVDAKAAAFAAAAAAAAEARRTEARLIHEVLHDGLTGLPNKRLLVDRLTQALARSKRAGTSVAVLFLDLDGFKAVNDTLGHAAGDQLLIGVAARLLECLRDTDTCARVGGDEFVIVCEDLSRPSDGALTADRLTTALAAGVPVGDQSLPVLATIGIALNSAGSLPAELLHEADTAMYRAKGVRQTPERRQPGGSGPPAADLAADGRAGPGTPPHTRRRTDRPAAQIAAGGRR